MGEIVRGYKVFNPDWTCRDKQYTCPGKFEEDGEIVICTNGMHFCTRLIDCFNYYNFDPRNKVAEVIGSGTVTKIGDKCCVSNLEIVRELSWQEVLDMTNIGVKNAGCGNTGNKNAGSWNTGTKNEGNNNSACFNVGDSNTGNYNFSDKNSGDGNDGMYNSGDNNIGRFNSGSYNSGDHNSGDWNYGDYNSGDWNSCDYSSGCFNTLEQKISLFNQPSDWTHTDWIQSRARQILNRMPYFYSYCHINFDSMTEKEKQEHPGAEITGGYLKKIDRPIMERNDWWRMLSKADKKEVMSLPNFNKEIFKELTGIDIDAKKEKDNGQI